MFPKQLFDTMWARLWPTHIVTKNMLLIPEIKTIERQFAPFDRLIMQPKAGFFVVPSGIEGFVGRTFTAADAYPNEVVLLQKTGRTLKLYHEIKNKETVSATVDGLENIVGCPILTASMRSTADVDGNHAKWPIPQPCTGPYDWTEITLSTAKGAATITFLISGTVDPGYDRRLDMIMY